MPHSLTSSTGDLRDPPLATTIGLLVGVPAQASEPGPAIHVRGGGEPSEGSTAAWPMGSVGDRHLLCDWDGDGDATAGLYRPSNGTWYIRNSPGGGDPQATFRYGVARTADRVLCGDWDGNGTETPGIFRPSTTTWYLRNRTSTGIADNTLRYGTVSSSHLNQPMVR